MKATYHCLNMFNFDVTEKAMVAECWMPLYDIPQIKDVLDKAAKDAGSTMAPILNEITVDEMPPTYNRYVPFLQQYHFGSILVLRKSGKCAKKIENQKEYPGFFLVFSKELKKVKNRKDLK